MSEHPAPHRFLEACFNKRLRRRHHCILPAVPGTLRGARVNTSTAIPSAPTMKAAASAHQSRARTPGGRPLSARPKAPTPTTATSVGHQWGCHMTRTAKATSANMKRPATPVRGSGAYDRTPPAHPETAATRPSTFPAASPSAARAVAASGARTFRWDRPASPKPTVPAAAGTHHIPPAPSPNSHGTIQPTLRPRLTRRLLASGLTSPGGLRCPDSFLVPSVTAWPGQSHRPAGAFDAKGGRPPPDHA